MLISLDQAVSNLKQGQLVAMPTETVYGLAGIYDNPQAIDQIFAVKERPFFDPLICHIASFNMMYSLAREVSPLASLLAEKFWPGPMTLVLPRIPELNPRISSGLDTVGIRFPSHPLAQELILRVGKPLCAPSANKFGKTSPVTAAHVEKEFSGEVAVLDGGACSIGIESSVLRIVDDKIYILRPGSITEEILREFLRGKKIKANIEKAPKDLSDSPGHTEQHYQPDKPFFLFSEKSLKIYSPIALIHQNLNIPSNEISEWKLPPDPVLAARQIYTDLREYSEHFSAFYLVRLASQTGGHWDAIFNRLEKAASFRY